MGTCLENEWGHLFTARFLNISDIVSPSRETMTDSFDTHGPNHSLISLHSREATSFDMTTLNPVVINSAVVYTLFQRLQDGVIGPVPDVVHLFSVVIDLFMPHLNILTLGLMAQTCKSWRVMTSHVELLNYFLRLMPPSNSEATRLRFLIPRAMPLHRISRGFYSQPHSFILAIQKYGGLKGFRAAVEKRRVMTNNRRECQRNRLAAATAARVKRSGLVTDAMTVLGLPANTYMAFTPAILFVNNVPPLPKWMEEHQLAKIVDQVCWLHYLSNFTDFHEQCEVRIEIMGDYPGLFRDVMYDYTRPSIYPWLV